MVKFCLRMILGAQALWIVFDVVAVPYQWLLPYSIVGATTVVFIIELGLWYMLYQLYQNRELVTVAVVVIGWWLIFLYGEQIVHYSVSLRITAVPVVVWQVLVWFGLCLFPLVLRHGIAQQLDRLMSVVWQRLRVLSMARPLVLLVLTCWLVAQFNLLLPYYILLSDAYACTVHVFALGNKPYQQSFYAKVKHGQKWLPPQFAHYGNTPRQQYALYVSRVADKYQLPQVLFWRIIAGESRGLWLQIPYSHSVYTGPLELGLTQIQPKWLQLKHRRSLSWWPDWMHRSTVYSAYLEYQRANMLAWLCSIQLWSPLEWLRYWCVISIDDRLSTDVFDLTGEILAEGKKHIPAGVGRLEDVLVVWWNTGSYQMKNNILNTYKTAASNLP